MGGPASRWPPGRGPHPLGVREAGRYGGEPQTLGLLPSRPSGSGASPLAPLLLGWSRISGPGFRERNDDGPRIREGAGVSPPARIRGFTGLRPVHGRPREVRR